MHPYFGMMLEEFHRKHWEKRWGKKGRLDSFMGGRGIGAVNLYAADLVVKRLRALSVLDIGAGSWRFLSRCNELDCALFLAGTELPFERAMHAKPAFIEGHFSWQPFPLPWPDGLFDVAHQSNVLPNMRTSHLPDVLAEIARVSSRLVCSGSFRCRFWEMGKATSVEKARWLRARIDEFFALESVERHGITVWKTREKHSRA